MVVAKPTNNSINVSAAATVNTGKASVTNRVVSNSVQGSNNMAEYWAREAEKSQESAAESADKAAQYATQSTTGMLWVEIKVDEWVLENGLYHREIDSLLAISGVYKGTWENKKLINVDIVITDSKAIIYSYAPFDGFVLGSTAILGSEDQIPKYTTLDTLAQCFETDVVDITGENVTG